jgi:hypothetical protein
MIQINALAYEVPQRDVQLQLNLPSPLYFCKGSFKFRAADAGLIVDVE